MVEGQVYKSILTFSQLSFTIKEMLHLKPFVISTELGLPASSRHLEIRITADQKINSPGGNLCFGGWTLLRPLPLQTPAFLRYHPENLQVLPNSEQVRPDLVSVLMWK